MGEVFEVLRRQYVAEDDSEQILCFYPILELYLCTTIPGIYMCL